MQAFQAANMQPRWKVGDEVEVAFEGKGFQGSWAAASVVKLDGHRDVLVRFREFVDLDGSPLVEKMGIERLRLPPLERTDKDWVPPIGSQVEALWSDAWWEGIAVEYDFLKGVLFQYDRYTGWLWLPLRCIRPRPSLDTYYPERSPDECDGEMEQDLMPSGLICGLQGCKLPNNHLGLCQVGKVKKLTPVSC